MATDQELVEQVRRGEREAYAGLFRKYYDYIYVICLSIVKNPQDAEELAQEMFVHAYFKLDQLRNPARFFPWLKKMAHNRSKNYAQRTKARIIQMPFSETQRKSAAPDEELLRQELTDAIMEAIKALPPKDREVVQARIDGLNHEEISERFGISVQASVSRLYRARRRLADHMKGLYGVLGLSKILHLKEIISGGVLIMKIGIGAKVTIGVIGVLAVGFVGFKIATRQPDQEILPPTQAIQETYAKSTKELEISQQVEDKKKIQTQSESTTVSPDSPEEDVKEEDIEEFLAILDQMGNQESSEETVVDPKDELFLRRFQMTRAETEKRTAELEEELRYKVPRGVFLYTEGVKYINGPDPAMQKEGWKMIDEYKRLWEDLTAWPPKMVNYNQYMHALGRGTSLAEGGWIYELQKSYGGRRLISGPMR